MTPPTDAADAARGAATPRRDVLFVHIQKTAGMSLYNSMAEQFGAAHSRRFQRSSEEFRRQFLALGDDEIAGLRLLSGHFELPFWLRRKLSNRFVVSLLREPVERVLSAYRYAKSWPGHRRHDDIGAMTVDEYIAAHAADASRHNWQCRKFCGVPDFAAAKAMIDRQVDLVGTVELMGEFTEALADALDVPLAIRSDNRSPDASPRRDDLDAAQITRLQQCNVEDYKLWAHVIERHLVRGHVRGG